MYIKHLGPEPIYTFPCVNVAPGGKEQLWTSVPLLSATVEGLPDSLDALLIAADLQFVDTDEVPPDQRRLLGESIAEELGLMAQMGLLPDPERTGVLLAGDLYVHPDLQSRGGLGDVTPVWRAFGEAFAWVAGVAGNHDSFQGQTQVPAWLRRGKLRLLDGDVLSLGGLKVGGVSGILGNPDKAWRKSPEQYLEALRAVLEQKPDLVLLHESPQPRQHSGRGKPLLTRALEENADPTHPPLVISGHVHWAQALDGAPGAPQLLNVEERVVLLTREALPPL